MAIFLFCTNKSLVEETINESPYFRGGGEQLHTRLMAQMTVLTLSLENSSRSLPARIIEKPQWTFCHTGI